MNKTILVGFISKKGIELKYTAGNGKAVATYTLSVPNKFKKGEYDFINCVTWGNNAEWLANNQDKIKRILIEGRIQTRQYDAKDGSKKYVTEVVTDSIEVIEWSNSIPENIGNDDINSDNVFGKEVNYDDSPF